MFNTRHKSPLLSPELEQRIRGLASELGVRSVRITELVNDRRASMWEGDIPPVPWGGYSPSLRELDLQIPKGATDATIETVALHELGHAATVPHTAERSKKKRLENGLGFISDETRAEEIAAWEWAAPRYSLATIPMAAHLAPQALGSYGVSPADAERIRNQIWDAADPSAARPQS